MVANSAALLGLGLGIVEIVLLGTVAVLLFGQKLPEVARQFGAQYREFRKHITSIQSEITSATNEYSSAAKKTYKAVTSLDDYDDTDQATAPKFEPPPAEDEA